MSINYVDAQIEKCKWKKAVYGGQPVTGLLVSNTGLMRRVDRYGQKGQVTAGTPNFDKATGRLRQFMVCITTDKNCHRCVNLHRIIYETFKGEQFGHLEDVDHIDNNVANGHISNLQKLSHKENCLKKNIQPPRKTTKAPIASMYRYQICLQLNCRTLKQLPRPYINEYYRLRYCEVHGLPAIPKSIIGYSTKKVA